MNKIKNKNILFLLTVQPDPRFVKQINFLAENHKVIVLYFSRKTMVDLFNKLDKKVYVKKLGCLSNEKYFMRILIFIRSLSSIHNHIFNYNINTIIFDKFDALFIYYLMRFISWKTPKNTIKIMEVPDLKLVNFSKSLVSKLYRFVEQRLMNKLVDKLIVTSPKFYDDYYKTFYKGDVFVLENKPLSTDMPDVLEEKKSLIEKHSITVGLIGSLNRGKPTKAILDLAVKNRWIKLNIYGVGAEENIVKEYARNNDNIKYFGSFDFFKEVKNIYCEVDVVYIVYDIDSSINIKLALPNKLYESMYFKVPVLVSKKTYLAERVENYKIGIAVDFNNDDEIIKALKSIKKEYSSFISKFDNIPKENYLGDLDCKELEDFIK